MRCSPTINVDRLKPFVTRVDAPPPPGPVTDAGQEGEHEVELLLNRRTIRGVTRYLVRWRGHASPEDQWLRKEELTHCPERVAEYNAAASRRRSALRAERAAAAAPRPRLPEGPATPVGPHAPVGFRLARPDEVLAGAAAGTALLTKSILLLPALPLLLAASLVARREARPVRAGARPAIGGIPLRPRVLMIGALLGALWALFELTRFGTLGGGYAGEGFTTPFGTGFRGLTILPNKGILFYAPIFFLVPFGFVALQRRDRPLALALCLSPLLFLFAISTWWAWDGQIGWGPRLLLPALPPLLLLAALGAHHLGRTGWLAFGSLLLAGAAVNLPGVLAPYSAVEMAVASDPPARHLALTPSWWPPRIAFDYLGARWKGGDVASRLATEAFAGIEPPAVSAFAGKASNLKVYFWPSLVGNPAFEVDEVLPALVLPFRWPFLGRSWLDPSFSMSDPWRLVVRDQAIRALDTGRPERTLTLANLLLERGDRPPDPRDVALRAEAYRLEGRIPEARAEASRLADACHPMLLWPRALTGASLDCVPPLSRQGIRASIERSGRAGWTLPGWLRSFRAATRERPYGGP